MPKAHVRRLTIAARRETAHYSALPVYVQAHMLSAPRLSPRVRRTILEQISRDRLAELTVRMELEVDDRRSTDSHIDAIVRKRSLDFGRVLEGMQREELKAACEALGLDSGGREKAKLIERIFGYGEPSVERDEPAQAPLSRSSTPPPVSPSPTSALKSELRRFVLDVAGGYRGRAATTEFTSRLLRCFGWPDGQAPDESMPAPLAIVANGVRTTREVALFWKARSVLVEVVKHDVMLAFAWKELLRVCLQIELAPLWWTPRRGLLSPEFRQCSREKSIQIRSRRTPFAV